MKDVLAVALTSMRNDMARVDRVALNLANVATPGYKRDVVAVSPFADALQAAAGATAADGSGPPDDAGAVRVLTDLRPGTTKVTGLPLDLAITGEGFFEVATPEGPAYTRQGNFHLDGRGRLVTAQGHPVMGRGGEIQLASSAPAIDADGNITEPDAPGAQGAAGTIVARLKIVRPEDAAHLTRIGDGLFAAESRAAEVGDGRAQLRQGVLENANVSSMQEMVQLMETVRHFESMQRVAQGYDEMMGSAIRRLGEL